MRSTEESPDFAPASADQVIAGRYRVVERIGVGGMAEVYRARDEALGRDVATKIFRREFASAADVRRQQDEIRLLANLSHPALVTLFDATSDSQGRAVLVLEYVAGSDARKRLESGPLDGREVAAIGSDIAGALAYIHQLRVVHRDVSPANILLPASPSAGVAAKLTDLGIARLIDDAKVTATGTVIGTASYLSPEQARGDRLTSASDVYSLGLVLLELLTGRREFPGTAAESAVARLSRDPWIPAALSPAWRDLLAEMTARDPGRRPAAHDVATRLSRVAAEDAPTIPLGEAAAIPVPEAGPGSPTAAIATRRLPSAETETTGPTRVLPPPVAAASPTRLRRRRPATVAIVALGALIAVVAGVLTVGSFAGGNRAPSDPVSTYPAVGGTLGDHLKQLEREVSRTETP